MGIFDVMKKIEEFFNVISLIVLGIPLLIVGVVLISPVLLYLIFIDGPRRLWAEQRFIRQHQGHVVLCIGTSNRYRFINESFLAALQSKGVQRVVVFDSTRADNTFDRFNWNNLINRSLGFPQLVVFQDGKMESVSLKENFISFFKKEIDKRNCSVRLRRSWHH